MVRRPKVFYGWIIIGISIIGLTLVYGVRHSFSVFFPPILDDFGWSRGSTAVMLSLNMLIYGLVAPVTGSLGDRWKPRRIMFTGIIIIGLSTAICAYASELWHFYLLFGILLPLGMAMSGQPLMAPAVANWFTKRRALALGLAQTGGGLSFAYGMLAELCISWLGWRHAYFVLAGLLAAVLLPLYLLFHYRPESKGLSAYGSEEMPAARDLSSEVAVAKEPVSHGWTLGQAMRHYRLWLLVLSEFLYWGIAAYLVLAHQVKFAMDAGYSGMFAASVFALFGFLVVAGQTTAFISDLTGREITITFSTILAIGAVSALLLVHDTAQPWLLHIYAICFGYGSGLFAATAVTGAADIFHGKHFGTIIGLLLMGMGTGGAIGPWLGGYIYDISGSYVTAFILCIACFVLACIAFWIAAPRRGARPPRTTPDY